MKIIILFLLGILLASSNILAQETEANPQLFRGVIMDRDSISNIPNATYLINDKETHIANKDGEFLFFAQQGDIVKFSHIGYKPLYLQVTDSLKDNRYLMGIFLSKDTIQLSEIIIVPQNINPNAYARTLPLMTTSDEVTAQNNINRSAYQAKTQPVTVWDAEMNQKSFIQAKSNDIVYKHQYQPDQLVEVSNVEISDEIKRLKLKDQGTPRKYHLTEDEWEYLIATYNERQKILLQKAVE